MAGQPQTKELQVILNVTLQNWATHVERLIAVFLAAMGAQLVVGGQTVDLSTKAGQSALLTAAVSAVYFMLRESTGASTPPPTPPSS